MSNTQKPNLLHRVVRRIMGTLTQVQTDAPVVALTFDDGPHAEFTPRLLDILDQHEAKATFFVLGQSAHQHADIIERMSRSGHAIGNHTWDHPSFPLIKRAERWAQVRACANATAPYGMKLFRPPYGHQTFTSRLDLWLLGYQVVTWNIVAQDWLNQSAESLAERVAAKLKPGSIVLLHDALHTASSEDGFDRTPTLRAVEILLHQFRHQMQFVTVPDLMRYGRPQYSDWQHPPNMEWLNTRYQQNGQARHYTPI